MKISKKKTFSKKFKWKFEIVSIFSRGSCNSNQYFYSSGQKTWEISPLYTCSDFNARKRKFSTFHSWKKKQGDFCLNTESLSFLDHLARGYFCSNIGQFSFHYWSNFGTIFDLFVIFQRFFNFHQILTSWQLFVHPLLKKGNYFHSCVELLF